ncbi:MAG: hypothetical protein ACREOW_15565 [Thermodesulfobacteriota bacterium]
MSEIRRLVLAKKLYLHGCSHASAKDEVSRVLAIHHFDNAVEIVLKCVATKCGAVSSSKQEYRFKDLWDKLVQSDANLPLKDQMFSLHDLRNLVQHQGDIPSMESTIKYKGYVEDFFKKVCSEIFNVPYERLYLSQLIEHTKLREQVLEAETAFEKVEFKRCIELCDDALISATFEEADIFYTAGMLTGYWGASEELKKVTCKDYPEEYKEKDFYWLARDLSEAILQLGQAVTGMQFLDEYRMDFLKHRQIIETLEDLSDNELKDSAEFSFNFVTDLILKWQAEGIFRRDEKK